MLAVREVGSAVLEQRDLVDVGVADGGRRIGALLRPPRHPGVADVDREALRPAFVGDELQGVVRHRAQVQGVLVEAGERGIGPRELESRERRIREPRRALEAWHLVERVRQELVAQGPAAAKGDVTRRLECRRRLVEAAEVPLDVGAAAAGVGHVERDAVGQLALDAGRELMDVRHDEVGVREARAAPEERQRPQGAARGRLDPARPGIRQRVGRRTAAIIRGDQRGGLAEPVVERLAGRIEEVLAVTGAEHRLVVDRVGGADPDLIVVLVVLPRPVRGPVDADEPDAAHHRLADARRDRVDDRRIERVVQHAVGFLDRAIEIPPEAEVQRPLAGDAPVVLDPRRDEEPLIVRHRVDVDVAAARRAEQERGESVPLEHAGAVQRAARELARERDVAARIVVVLVEDVGPPHVEAAADVVRAPRHRHVRLKRVVPVAVRARAAGERDELVHVDNRENATDRAAGQLADEARGPEFRRVEPDPVFGVAPLQEVGVTATQVEHRPRAEDVHPVADNGPVGAPEGQLAVLCRAAANGGGVPHLVALVLAPAEEGAVFVAEVVVDLEDPVPEQILVEVLGIVQVVLPRRDAGGRVVRVRVVLHHRRSRRRDAVCGDDVARERIARPHAVDVAACRRVENRGEAPLRVDKTREVASLHRSRRRRRVQRGRRAFPVLLGGKQEERLVLPDWTVDAEAVLVDVLVGLGLVARVEEERVGRQVLAPHEVVADAVEAVRAGLERHVDDAAGGAPVLRVVRVGRDLELLHGFGRRDVGDVVPALVGVVGRAVEQELVVAVLAAVHRPVGERAVVEGAEVDGLGVVGDAGDQRGERHRAAGLERQLRDASGVDDGAAARIARFEQWRFRRDRDHFRHAADSHLDIDGRGLVDLEHHARPGVLLEPLEFDRHLVPAGAKERQRVGAFGVGDRRRHFVRVRVAHRDGCTRKGALVAVDDLAANRRAELLRRRGGAGQRQK